MPLSVADLLASRLQAELAEIRRRIPIAAVAQFSTVMPAAAATADEVATPVSASAQLAAEREQHRQRLDEVWRCAQGWRARCKATEDALRRLAGSVVSAELARFVEVEERYRLEIAVSAQQERDERIMAPFVRGLLRALQGTSGPHPSVALGVQPLHLFQQSGSGSSGSSHNTVHVTRVKDSELLRALRAAEAKLAQLGQPSVSSPLRSAGSFEYVS